eukprot:CAMPEP_0172921158 /NCGR_PEP_ID=MMETSP1075-20121228/205358_1 /TAXON_ID=2916 /ORGANISM="Ceratium fusus, Strain PA161109" /LENGTH=224 /DNA_ID=CAMNT_0013781277 /DNA_START=23 /DNA_END=697 /DNA_ORIENTATION=+
MTLVTSKYIYHLDADERLVEICGENANSFISTSLALMSLDSRIAMVSPQDAEFSQVYPRYPVNATNWSVPTFYSGNSHDATTVSHQQYVGDVQQLQSYFPLVSFSGHPELIWGSALQRSKKAFVFIDAGAFKYYFFKDRGLSPLYGGCPQRSDITIGLLQGPGKLGQWRDEMRVRLQQHMMNLLVQGRPRYSEQLRRKEHGGQEMQKPRRRRRRRPNDGVKLDL